MRACSFCGSVPAGASVTKCRSCGAPLPVPGTERARLPPGAMDRVPPAPRTASFKVVSASSGFAVAWGAIFGGIGGGMGCLFLVIGIVTALLPMALIGGSIGLLFGGIGGTVFFFGYRSASRQLRTFRIGQPVEANLLTIHENAGVQINGRHPWVLSYTFTWDGEERTGECSTLDPRAQRFEEGDAIIVLVDPVAPESQALYLH